MCKIDKQQDYATSVCAKSLQLSPTLCDPMDLSLQDSSVCGILQARILKWVAMPSPGDLPYSGINPPPLMSPACVGGFFTISATWEAIAQGIINL